MSDPLNIKKIGENLLGYFETKIELLKIEIQEDAYHFVAKFISLIILLFISFITVGFASLTLGNYLNDILNSEYLGYGIITLFYSLILIALLLIKDSPIIKKIVSAYFYKSLSSKKPHDKDGK